MTASSELLMGISKIVAQYADQDNLKNIAPALNAIFPSDMNVKDKEEALEEAVVYSLEANHPGYPSDGQPGFLWAGEDLKAVILNEIRTMIKADFDNSEHADAWASLEQSLADAPESNFLDGVSINCPDDYILNLERVACAQLLRLRQAYPRF